MIVPFNFLLLLNIYTYIHHTYNKFTLSALMNYTYNSQHTFRDSHFNSKLTCRCKEIWFYTPTLHSRMKYRVFQCFQFAYFFL